MKAFRTVQRAAVAVILEEVSGSGAGENSIINRKKLVHARI